MQNFALETKLPVGKSFFSFLFLRPPCLPCVWSTSLFTPYSSTLLFRNAGGSEIFGDQRKNKRSQKKISRKTKTFTAQFPAWLPRKWRETRITKKGESKKYFGENVEGRWKTGSRGGWWEVDERLVVDRDGGGFVVVVVVGRVGVLEMGMFGFLYFFFFCWRIALEEWQTHWALFCYQQDGFLWM